ncbi:elongation of very long chain fatty acids protein AAEL008004-like [Ceratina calcarata]|uniref:Elongation of very long chain fatty acids protein n=1 Tax=Ceratina calcarata TaxID=156304 RepID=A0AAJ7J324_9HYME|nr:elongation of very long chain fatty acids protein AAEL008004-like [Ceratina calcarata]
MTTLIRQIYQGYCYVNDELSDPRTQDLFLISSPWALVGIITFYLYFVFDLGPNWMARKKPLNLDKIVQLYDLLQIIVCTYLLYKALTLAWLNDYSFYCQPVDYSYDPRAVEISKLVWVYFMVKVFDLFDTIFFVLRKKQGQISFLHVYHHVGMTLGSWIAAKFFPGGQVTFIGTINSFVHIVMYTHYLATSLKISKPWWKKYITQLQLTQFCLILLQFIFLISTDCNFPKWTAAAMIPQNLFMIMMFGEFYYKTYIKKRKSNTDASPRDVPNGSLKSQ